MRNFTLFYKSKKVNSIHLKFEFIVKFYIFSTNKEIAKKIAFMYLNDDSNHTTTLSAVSPMLPVYLLARFLMFSLA